MERVILDCTGLHNIRLDKGNLPDTIYIDGSEFLRNLEITLDRTQTIDAETYKHQEHKELRDMFAAKAMQSLMMNGDSYGYSVLKAGSAGDNLCLQLHEVAKASYEYADAMLEAREK